MTAFVYTAALQWRMDFRDREVLLTYYLVPLVFFALMGGVFVSVMPDSRETLTQSMTVFGVSMGAILGAPTALVRLLGSEAKDAYRVGRVPLWTVMVCNFLSGFVHLFAMSLIVWALAPVMFDAARPDLPGYLPVLALFLTASLAVGTVLGVTVRSSSRLTMIGQLVFLPSILLSGIMVPADLLPDAISAVGRALPAFWGFAALTDGSGASAVWVLAALTVALLAVSAYRIRRLAVAKG